jgi:hypothetical protein
MTNGTRKGWGISVTPWPLFTPGKDPVPILQEAGWAPRPFWTGAKNLASPPGFDSRTVQPVASRYTDWATRSTMHCKKHIGYFRIWTADDTTYLCTLVLYSFPLTVAINWGLPCYIYVNLNLIYDLTYTGQKQRCKKLRNYKSKHESAIYGNLPIFIVLLTILSTFRKRHFPFSYFHTKGLVKIQKGSDI